jgi:hypothetical protein
MIVEGREPRIQVSGAPAYLEEQGMDVVYARQTCSVAMPYGGQMTVREGSHWPADDPLVEAHRDLFTADPAPGLSYSRKPVESAVGSAVVEQATAAPGERRQVRRADQRG